MEGEDQGIRKGPWKAEEDQVLINHVNKFGPKDWSSLRSNGLLRRTGKSCRLRWVNKLRPNLKNGCKFTAEEERIVIEMQAQLGNKWAKIATYLPGRTDNDVKNFWSSRRKRLARILHAQTTSSSSSSSSKPQKCGKKEHISTLMEGESSTKVQPSSRPTNTATNTNTISNPPCLVPQATLCLESQPTQNDPKYENPTTSNEINIDFYSQMPFLFPFPITPYPQPDVPFIPLETLELIDRLDSGFLASFGCGDESGFVHDGAPFPPYFGVGPDGKESTMTTPDSFFEDFPSDVFDQIEHLPSPSQW